jgi:translation initiation factor 1
MAGPRAVRVGRETKGRAGKGVTTVTGLPLSPADLEALAARLKKRCGSGGTVREGVIEIQGEHRDTLVSELCKLGWPAKKSGG